MTLDVERLASILADEAVEEVDNIFRVHWDESSLYDFRRGIIARVKKVVADEQARDAEPEPLPADYADSAE